MTDENHQPFTLNISSKAVEKFLELTGNFIWGISEPFQMKRIATAKADVARIEAESDSEIAEYKMKALTRFVREEVRHQKNIEDIRGKAAQYIRDDASPEEVHQDWFDNFFKNCRGVSDQEMQELWSRVLAGEANRPSSFSRKTVNLLTDLGASDAKSFSQLCRYTVYVGDAISPVVLIRDDNIYLKTGVNFRSLNHLDDLGLIKVNHQFGFNQVIQPGIFQVIYGQKKYEACISMRSSEKLDRGCALFTKAGVELSNLCDQKPVEGFVEYLQENWKVKYLNLSSNLSQTRSDEFPNRTP